MLISTRSYHFFLYFRAVMGNICEGLNDEQRKAVECVEGPVLIVAGAGSGKTRVLTSRVAHILESGVDPSRILALTFTKKAAGEMKERIALMVGAQRARKVVMGTFHAVFVRFLREFAESLGYPSSFTIYDTSDSQSAIKACVKELQLDDKIYKPKDVLSRISMAKNNLITVSAYRNKTDLMLADQHCRRPRLVDVYALYQQKMKQAGVMDFDDILLNMNYLLRDNPEALQSISERFSYIMVDEYQDTNYAQYLIIKKLSRIHRNICVVGDDSQSIYAFRGARVENILNFKKDYPENRVFKLERNYRSTQTIVKAANSLISKNEGRIPKECYAVGEDGELIRILKTYSEQEEAMMIVSEILSRMRSAGAQYQDFAILYRTNAQSRAIEEQLRRRNIPYMIYSGNSFFERAEVKDLMAYFKLVVNPNDDESFKRVVNKPARAIGDTSVSALNECARAHGCSLFKAAFMQDTEQYGLRPAALSKVQAFCRMIDSLAAKALSGDAFEIARQIADESGLYAFYKSDNSIEGLARTANVEELINSVESFVEERLEENFGEAEPDPSYVVTIADFLENVTLLSNADTSDDDETNNKVSMMTVHSAKGLEYPYVFVAGMEENLFPSLNMLSSLQEIEEERRLFYVAITRAKRSVTLSFASTRMRNGQHESNAPSRFIREIDSIYLENPLSDEDFDTSDISWSPFAQRNSFGRAGGYARSGAPGSLGRQSSPASASKPVAGGFRNPSPAPAKRPDLDFEGVPMTQLFAGERVEHNRFGAGTIKSIGGAAPDMKAVIEFDEYGEKLLLLKYAKIRPLK